MTEKNTPLEEFTAAIVNYFKNIPEGELHAVDVITGDHKVLVLKSLLDETFNNLYEKGFLVKITTDENIYYGLKR